MGACIDYSLFAVSVKWLLEPSNPAMLGGASKNKCPENEPPLLQGTGDGTLDGPTYRKLHDMLAAAPTGYALLLPKGPNTQLQT